MSDYDTREERAALEADFDQLPDATATVDEVSTVISVRLRGEELAAVERAAAAAKLPLSTFIRQSALNAAAPLDVRAASSQAETVEKEARKLVALLHGDAA